MANLWNSPTAIPFPDEDCRHVLPYRRLTFTFADLGSGASDTIAFPVLPTFSIPMHAEFEITTAWTVGGGDTTGLTMQIGDAADPDELRTAGNVVGVAVGIVADSVMGRGADHLGGALESTAYAPIVTATPTGGAAELDHVDAGAAASRVYFISIPTSL